MELKAHVWFPTLIWQATLPDSEKEMLSDMKDYSQNDIGKERRKRYLDFGSNLKL